MEELSIIVPIILLGVVIGGVALIVWTMRRGNVVVDIRQIYFYLVAFATLLMGFFGALQLVGQMFTLLLPYSDGESNIFTRQQIVGTLSVLLIALPVWWFHWQPARRRALATQRLLALRIYLYAVTIIALVTAVIVGGIAVSEIVKTLFGLVDFSSADSVRMFWKDELTAVVNLLTALLVWFYHWRSVEHVPADG